MELNFNNTKKKFLVVTLNNEQRTKLLIKTPTKLLMEKIFQMQKDIDEVDENNLDEVYELLSEIMSRNVKNIKISAKELEEILDFEDIFIFFNCYTNFINGIVKSKNYNSPTIRNKKK